MLAKCKHLPRVRGLADPKYLPHAGNPRSRPAVAVRMPRLRNSVVIAGALVTGAVLSACSDPAPTPAPPPADRSTLTGAVTGYFEMLKTHPDPTAEDVNAWVSPREQGKDHVRTWFSKHPDVHVTVASYRVAWTNDTDEKVAIDAEGEVCSSPGKCVPLKEAADHEVKVERKDVQPEEYTLSYKSALRLLGEGAGQ